MEGGGAHLSSVDVLAARLKGTKRGRGLTSSFFRRSFFLSSSRSSSISAPSTPPTAGSSPKYSAIVNRRISAHALSVGKSNASALSCAPNQRSCPRKRGKEDSRLAYAKLLGTGPK